MKRRGISFLSGAALLLLCSRPAVAEDSSEELQYSFGQPSTNAYKLAFTFPSQSSPEKFEGIIVVQLAPAENSNAVASFFGTVRQIPRNGPNLGPAFVPGPFASRRFGRPRLFDRVAPLMHGTETDLAPDGRILRVPFSLSLPPPARNYAALMFPVLPGDQPVKTEQTEFVDDETYPAMPMFPRGRVPGTEGPRRLAGTTAVTQRNTGKTADEIRFERSESFRSWLKSDQDPYLSWSMKESCVFDRKDALLKSAKLEGTVLNSTPDFIQKFPFVITVERLTGDELKKAIAANNRSNPAGAVSSDNIEKLIADVKAGDPAKSSAAMNQLQNINPEQFAKQLAELAPLAAQLATNSNPAQRSLGTRILIVTATQKQVPLLLKILNSDSGDDFLVCQALGRLNDKRAIAPLTQKIVSGSSSAHAAADALAQFGSDAEDAAISLLNEKHRETKQLACRILRECGTAKSIPALEAAVTKGQSDLIDDAATALRMIRQRGEQLEKQVF